MQLSDKSKAELLESQAKSYRGKLVAIIHEHQIHMDEAENWATSDYISVLGTTIRHYEYALETFDLTVSL